MSDKREQKARTYEPGKVKLQVFGRDEDAAVDRMAELWEDYPASEPGQVSGMSCETVGDSLVVIAGQLIRITRVLEGILEELRIAAEREGR